MLYIFTSLQSCPLADISTEKSIGAIAFMWGTEFNGGSPGTMTFSELIIFVMSKNARIKNRGSFEAYYHFSGILTTGLIGGLFGTYFPIAALWASNQE